MTGVLPARLYHRGMWFGDRLRGWLNRPADPGRPRTVQFDAGPTLPVDQLLLHLASKRGAVTREQALRVPGVLRGRNMICAIATLPLEAVDAGNRRQTVPLLEQFDPDVPPVVTLAQTIEDLLFDAVAWWRVVGFDQDGYPSRVRRYAPHQVSLTPPDGYQRGYLPSGLPTSGVVWMEGVTVPFSEVIRFDSPNPGLLDAGSDVVGRCIDLDNAARLYANSPRRRGYFHPSDGVDPVDDDAIKEILNDWARASARSVDGYVPAALAYTPIQDSTPAELQLVQMQQQAALDLANAIGIDPEDLGVNTTSRTYQNATDRRRDRINDVLSPFMRAITDRLTMPDVTMPGRRVRFALDDYLRADPKTRAEVQQMYVAMGVTDAAEVRAEEGKPARAVTPGPVRAVATVGDPGPARQQLTDAIGAML